MKGLVFHLLLVSVHNVRGLTLADIQNDLRGLKLSQVANLTSFANDPAVNAALTASGPKTFFVPNDAAFQNTSLNPAQAASTLLYHIIPGQLRTNDTLGTIANHSILTTALTGRSLTFLEAGQPAVLACGVPTQRVGTGQIEIYNQLDETFSTETHVNTDHNIVYHIINRIIDFPTNYPALMQLYASWHQYALTAGYSDDEVGAWTGFTLFVIRDQTFTSSQDVLANNPTRQIFNNHLVKGKSIWYDTFESETYHNELGKELKFTLADTTTREYMVAVGNSTGRISFSDRLLANGVIHQIESLLSDISPPPATTATLATTPAPTGTSSSSEGQSSNESLSGGAIAGIVIGCLALLAIIAIIFLICRKGRQERREPQTDPIVQKFPYSSASSEPPMTSDTGSAYFPATASITTREFSPVRRGVKGAPIPAPLPLSPLGQTGVSEPSDGGVRSNNGALSEDVVDDLLARLAARIDRPGVHGDDDQPPLYPV